MLTEICAELKNYFSSEKDRVVGTFKVVNGKIVPPVPLQINQYFRIVGSVFNDGVHAYNDVLTDEDCFRGAVWRMRVPQEILELDEEIEAWQSKNADVLASPYTSESFGGYSYSKATSGSGSSYGWKDAFASRLNHYRKIRSV